MSHSDDDGLTRERDRRVQGGILIAMAVMVVVGVVLAYLQVLAYHGGGGGPPEYHPQSVVEVDVPRRDWARLVEAVERFAEKSGLFMLESPAGLPVKESTSMVWLPYQGDKGLRMTVGVGKKGQFVVTFIDKSRNGAEQTLERAFRTDVIEAGGFRPLP